MKIRNLALYHIEVGCGEKNRQEPEKFHCERHVLKVATQHADWYLV
jgi:hypothetical protein